MSPRRTGPFICRNRPQGWPPPSSTAARWGCIGALWPIFDDPAALFAVDFYNEVLKGTMIGEAMRRARKKSREQYPENMTWAAFVLYGDPTSSLVE